MPIPFILGAVVGAAAVCAYERRSALKNLRAEQIAKTAGSAVENSIKKAANLGEKAAQAIKCGAKSAQNACSAKKPKKASKNANN